MPEIESPNHETGPAGRPTSLRRLDLVALGLVALLVRIPAYFSQRHLTFDDGVFASSVIAMRHGGVPFREVFSSQGPLFLPLVWLGDLFGGRSLDAPRTTAVISGLALTLLTYWAALAVADRLGALLAGAVTATSGVVAWVSGPIAADGPALAFAIGAVGLTLRLRRRPTMWLAAATGLAVGAALSTKAIEAHILVPVGLVLAAPLGAGLRERRMDAQAIGRALVAGIAALAVFVAISLPFGFADVWDQSFRYRTEAAEGPQPVANSAKMLSTLWDRDLVLYLFAAACVALALLRATRRCPRRIGVDDRELPADDLSFPSAGVVVASWAIATAGWLMFAVSPMWRAHVSAVTIPVALLLARHRPPRPMLATLAVVAIPLAGVQLYDLLDPGPYNARDGEIVAALEALPQGAWAIPDDPGWAWRAGRRTTDDLVDTSMLRVQQGRYSSVSLARQAADPRVCAVVISSPDRFGAFADLPSRLERSGYVVARSWEPSAALWVRPRCDPPADSS